MKNKNLSSHKNEEPESSILYIVGTPIGNLNDISYRALNVLRKVSLIACEDTRQTKKIMNKFEFKNKLISFNKNNSSRKIPQIIDNLESGKSIALVSDAGLPSICDPGEDLIKNAKLRGFNIVCIPGPCAALTALVSSGFPSSKFTFEGFLPKKNSERDELLLKLSKNEETLIVFESPRRVKKLLNEIKKYFGGDREMLVFRELTKKFEEHIGDNVDEIINYFLDKEVLGEITVVIKGKKKPKRNSEFNKFDLKREMDDLIKAGLSLSQASKYLAKKNNLTKNILYNL